MNTRTILLIALVSLLGGCATSSHLGALPKTAQEFSQPLETIRAQYPDVARFEQTGFSFSPAYADLEQLEEAWGPATRVETRWGERTLSALLSAGLVAYSILPVGAMVTLEAIHLYPQETHYWRKGDKRIEALIGRSGFLGYKRKLFHWSWSEGEESAERAKKIASN